MTTDEYLDWLTRVTLEGQPAMTDEQLMRRVREVTTQAVEEEEPCEA